MVDWLYPNPNMGNFIIEFNKDQQKSVEILDITGRKVFDKKLNIIGKCFFDISHLKGNVFYIKVIENKTGKEYINRILKF